MRPQQARIDLQSFFESGRTLDVDFRLDQLKKLYRVLKKNEKRILRALFLDLRKSSFEAYATEVGLCLKEIRHTIRHLKEWSRPQPVSVPLTLQPGEAFIQPHPYGTVLIFSPWNYPFQLLVGPMIGAIAAGNVVLAKPSELAPETSKVLREIFGENFDQNFIHIMEGDAEVAKQLLELQWDYIFFTGGTRIGKLVMKQAAEHLTPVTLELGGKSPAWIDASAPLETSLRRVLWGKFMNAGQTCVAPDYLLLHESHQTGFRKMSERILREFFGEEPKRSLDYGRIINTAHFERLLELLKEQKILLGGQYEAAQKYISPTLIEDPQLDSPLMKEEIFGPLLPVLTYRQESEVHKVLKKNPKPLAFYLFSKDKKLQKKMIEQYSFGGGVINDCLTHLAVPDLPFGGIGSSGMGHYHGKSSFETFSHSKSILKRGLWPDPNLRYPPYEKKLSLLRKILR